MSEVKVKIWLGLELRQLCKENCFTLVSNQFCHVPAPSHCILCFLPWFFYSYTLCVGFLQDPGRFPWPWEDTGPHCEREMHWKLLNTPKATRGASELARAGGWKSTWTRGSGQRWADPRTAALTLWTAERSSLNFLFSACLTQPLSPLQEGADSAPARVTGTQNSWVFFQLTPRVKWNLQVSSAGAEQAGRAEWLWDTSVTPSCGCLGVNAPGEPDTPASNASVLSKTSS